MTEPNFTERFLHEVSEIADGVSPDQLDTMAQGLAAVREGGGRLFIVGVGGGAGHASHAVNDFRKLCSIEAYAPTDNVSELTARTNDEGWETTFEAWLRTSRFGWLSALSVLESGARWNGVMQG